MNRVGCLWRSAVHRTVWSMVTSLLGLWSLGCHPPPPDVGELDAISMDARPFDMGAIDDALGSDSDYTHALDRGPDGQLTADLGSRDASVRTDGPISDAALPDTSTVDANPPSDGAAGDGPMADGAMVDRGLPQEFCANGIDDDGDELVDCEDPSCLGSASCFHVREICDDGRDNTGDGRVDCEDVYCHRRPGCPPPRVEPYTTAELQARFDAECIHCHGPPQPDLMLDLSAPFADAVVGVQAVELQMALIAPGKPEESWLYQKLRYRQLDFMGDGEGMPPEMPWSALEAERLALWIDALEEPE